MNGTATRRKQVLTRTLLLGIASGLSLAAHAGCLSFEGSRGVERVVIGAACRGPLRAWVRPAAGEVELFLAPQRTLASYTPCAQVDDTATNAGWNAGTKTLTVYAHEFSEASESVDADLGVVKKVGRLVPLAKCMES